MKYLVIFKDDDNHLHAKLGFTVLHDAQAYAAGVAKDREPMVLPVLNLNQDLNCYDHADMADLVGSFSQLFMFKYDKSGCEPMAEQMVIQACGHLDLARSALKMAETCQKRA